MKCKQCGFENSDAAKFCIECGTTLEQKSNKKKILWIIPIVGVVIAMIFFYNWQSKLKEERELIVQNKADSIKKIEILKIKQDSIAKAVREKQIQDSILLVKKKETEKKKVIPKTQFNPNVNYGTFTDARDGKTYKTVKIGSQIWMAENLAYKTNNGCWSYNNDKNNAKKYGYLYDWETSQTVCPSGWHLPNESEWEQLRSFVGEKFSGNILKSTISDWKKSSISASNKSGFSALPSGYIYRYHKDFMGIYSHSYYWTSTKFQNGKSITYVYCRLDYDLAKFQISWAHNDDKNNGYSIRCIKN